jgi:hypothetical protein
MPTENLNLSQADDLERQVLEERERRAKAKVERGEAILEQIFVVVGGAEDADDAIVSAKAQRLSELRAAGEVREIIFAEPNSITTGVPRPRRDPRYFERLTRDLAQQTVEQRQRDEAEAAAKVEVFHEGARSHEPEPTPAPMPMPVPIDVVPADDLEWHGIVVQMTGPTNGSLGSVREGTFAVSTRDAIRVLYVRNDAGSHIDTRLLHEGEDAKTIAKSLLRDHYMKRHNSFYDPISYPEKSIY